MMNWGAMPRLGKSRQSKNVATNNLIDFVFLLLSLNVLQKFADM